MKKLFNILVLTFFVMSIYSQNNVYQHNRTTYNTGVTGESASQSAVYGYSAGVDGVNGSSVTGNGVHGGTSSGLALYGSAISGNGLYTISNSGVSAILVGNYRNASDILQTKMYNGSAYILKFRVDTAGNVYKQNNSGAASDTFATKADVRQSGLSSLTVSQGLTKVGNDIRLGGDITSPLSITNGSNFGITFDGTGDLTYFDASSTHGSSSIMHFYGGANQSKIEYYMRGYQQTLATDLVMTMDTSGFAVSNGLTQVAKIDSSGYITAKKYYISTISDTASSTDLQVMPKRWVLDNIGSVTSTLQSKRLTLTNKTADYTVQTSDAGNVLTYSHASTTGVFTLPTIASGDIGTQIIFVKKNAGGLKIQAPASTYIADSSSAGYIQDTQTNETYATITLLAIDTTHWVIIGGHGTWVTY